MSPSSVVVWEIKCLFHQKAQTSQFTGISEISCMTFIIGVSCVLIFDWSVILK